MHNYKGKKREVRCPRNKMLVQELVKTERSCLADPNYLAVIQRGRITETMRMIALDWLFELIDSTGPTPRGAEVYTAACCMFDRYLSVQPISPDEVQDTALSALLCASRVLEPNCPLGISAMENYYRINRLKKLEDQFLNTVKISQDSLILPTDYYPSFTRSLLDTFSREVVCDVIYHSHNLLPVFYSEYESVLHPPSVIAGACLLESVNRLLGYQECLELLADIVTQTRLHPSYFIKATKDLRRWISKLTS
ncbi:G2/mitotic-specific cyclin-B2-like [Bolinopsis microptera]|uniref:G2/mitotic-specific cyclin-B2-like n=1 Tax=Bolinopsis microptera TaxID=2820187 RepID=UPI003079DB28